MERTKGAQWVKTALRRSSYNLTDIFWEAEESSEGRVHYLIWIHRILRRYLIAGRTSVILLLRSAHPAVVSYRPCFATDADRGIEEVGGIPLLLNTQQPVIVGAPERCLPILLVEIGLIHVRATPRGRSFHERLDYLCHLPLCCERFGPWGCEAPWKS